MKLGWDRSLKLGDDRRRYSCVAQPTYLIFPLVHVREAALFLMVLHPRPTQPRAGDSVNTRDLFQDVPIQVALIAVDYGMKSTLT
jgi:hypothetical protein